MDALPNTSPASAEQPPRELNATLCDDRITLHAEPSDRPNKHLLIAKNCTDVLGCARIDLLDMQEREKFARSLGLSAPDEAIVVRELIQFAIKVPELKRTINEEESEAFLFEPPPEVGTPRYNKAMALLTGELDILQAAVEDIASLGHVGDDAAKQQALLCAASAVANEPLQPSIHAPSSTGKNALCDKVLSLLPPERIIRRSALSAKALFRTEQTLKNCIVYIQEVEGSQNADYSIRILQSDGRLEYESTEKDSDGRLRNVVHVIEGPTVIFQTTTKEHLFHENETRCLPIYVDDSEEQTRRIVSQVLKEAEGQGIPKAAQAAILEAWRDAFRLLPSTEVIIPFARRLHLTTNSVRVRRDVRKLVAAIKVCAWLHQFQRQQDHEGRILATETDFEKARELLKLPFTRAHKEMTPSEERVWEAIGRLPQSKRAKGFKRRELGSIPNTPERTVKKCLQSLCESGYLESDGRMGRIGSTYIVIRDDVPGEFEISLAHLPVDGADTGQTFNTSTDHYDVLMGNDDLPIGNEPLPITDDSEEETIRAERAAIECEGDEMP